MRIVYFGSGEFGLPCLNALKCSKHSLTCIFTQPTQPAGRGRKPKPTPVTNWAQANSIPYTQTDDINSPEALDKVSACKPDLIVVIAFGQKIGRHLISLPAKAAINVHASLLPKYRGAAPVNWAIINGDTETGVSIITLAEKMDAGKILAQATIPIGHDETAGQLHDKLAELAAGLLIRTIEQIETGTAVYQPQDSSKVTKAPKLKKSDGLLDWNEPAATLRNLIRGVWPWPGAQADYLSKQTGKSCRVIIAAAEVVKASPEQPTPPGTIDENLNVICGKDALKITKIKPAGSALMDFTAFANGRGTAPGDRFVTRGS